MIGDPLLIPPNQHPIHNCNPLLPKLRPLDAYCQILAQRHQSINNLRSELRSLLESMGVDDDVDAKKRLQDAGALLDTTYNSAVAKANDISASEYRARKSKDYLKLEEVYEYEKFRIQDSYGMEVTEELVEKDDGGRLVRAIASVEVCGVEVGGSGCT